MKTTTTDVTACFGSIVGQPPWRARRGHGSFLTFDFGLRMLRGGHAQGTYVLWVYLSNWVLSRNDRELVNSDSDRRQIEVAVRRLEQAPFRGVELQSDRRETVFEFGDFRLAVSPADYIEDPDKRDNYWMFFMPEERVLAVGPEGVQAGPANAPLH